MNSTNQPELPVPKKKFPLKQVLILFLLFLLLSIGIICASGYWFIAKTAPILQGSLSLSSLKEKVTVFRDNMGVPHINAKNDHDLYMAQGYITAQDRLFQMDLSRRQASGQLSEVVGKATLDRDKYFLTLGLRRAAQLSWDAYPKDVQDVITWYAEGVNAYIKDAKATGKLPIEFSILGYTPTEWTPIDSLVIGKYMAFDLGGHWEGQAFRYYLLQHYPKEKALELFPTYPKDGATILPSISGTVDITKSLTSAYIPNYANGSNNWVVAGSKTASGKPLLANDPHLSLATPSIWYETHLHSNTVDVQGVIFAGIPGIILGHNQNIAWGVTNVGPDVQDLYIEKRNPTNKNEFLYNGKYEPASTYSYTIQVKGQKDIPYTVAETRHGPIISEFTGGDNTKEVFALKWTALQATTELMAILQMNRATNWDTFKEALTHFQAPAQNFVFASTDGTIAYRANGLIPIRKKGDSLLPVPGWTDAYEWNGYIPWDKLPTIVNPAQGYIATANNKVIDDSYPYHITNIWSQPYREMRIQEVLKNGKNLTVQEMQQLQMDTKDLRAQTLLPLFLAHLHLSNPSSIEKDALRLLQNWDYKEDKNAAAPLIFQTWINQIGTALFEKEFSTELLNLFDGKALVLDTLLQKAANGEDVAWIKDVGGFQVLLQSTFSKTINEIENMQGEQPSQWKWGAYHQIAFSHPLSSVKPLNLLFNNSPTYPTNGSATTVQAAGYNRQTGIVDHGGSWRGVMDLSNLSRSYHLVGPGQSGYVWSNWYSNQKEAWTTGTYHTTITDWNQLEKSPYKLVLKP